MQVLPARVTETVAPARLGRSIPWLFAATVVNNAGDGVAIAAGPLGADIRITAPFWFD